MLKNLFEKTEDESDIVDDRGNIIGTDDPKLEERIRNMIRSNCEPTVEPTIEMKTIEDKNILLVKVSEGYDKRTGSICQKRFNK